MAAANEIDPLDIEIESIGKENGKKYRASWKTFHESHTQELIDKPWELNDIRLIKKLFILSANICESGKAEPQDVISTINKSIELKPHAELSDLFKNWTPETSIEEIIGALKFHDTKGLGNILYQHLSQKVDPAIPIRLANIAFHRS